MKAGVWITAIRPKTLWASVSPVLVGTAVAWHDGQFHLPAAAVAMIGGLLIQIGTNLANDLFDFEHGADTKERMGPLRVTQAGLASPRQMRMAISIAFGLATVCGIYLVSRGGWPVVLIGLLSIAAGVLYTGGPYPLGYHGWGDSFVFVFFGPVAVVGTYYVQALSSTALAWLTSIPMGALATSILVVNNVRDLDTDRRAGKRTLAVRFGRFAMVGEYALMMLIATGMPVALLWRGMSGAAILAAAVVILAAAPVIVRTLRNPQAVILNSLLAKTALLQLIYAIVFSVGINL